MESPDSEISVLAVQSSPAYHTNPYIFVISDINTNILKRTDDQDLLDLFQGNAENM